MTTLALDSDFNFVDGENYTLLTGCEETAQNVRVCLSISPGESCVFPNAGVDWFSPAMRNERFAASILRTKISSVEGVDVINSLTFNTDSNRFSNIQANVTANGETLDVLV